MEMKNFGYLPISERVIDTQYRKLLSNILQHGESHSPIHGDKSKRLIGYPMRFKRANGLPAVIGRDLAKYNLIHGAIGENIAFMNGARTLEQLEDYGCPQSFWKKWVTEEKCANFGLPAGDLGPGSYGPAWAAFPKPDGGTFHQILAMVRLMKERPILRTIKAVPWIPYYTVAGDSENPRNVVVAPCHGWIQVHINTEVNTFKLTHNQRSADCPVGLQFNMVQYFCMGLMFERVTGIHFDELVYYIEDAHIYEMQLTHAERLIENELNHPNVYPEIHFTDDAPTENILDFRPEHFVVKDYKPNPWFQIPTPV